MSFVYVWKKSTLIRFVPGCLFQFAGGLIRHYNLMSFFSSSQRGESNAMDIGISVHGSSVEAVIQARVR